MGDRSKGKWTSENYPGYEVPELDMKKAEANREAWEGSVQLYRKGKPAGYGKLKRFFDLKKGVGYPSMFKTRQEEWNFHGEGIYRANQMTKKPKKGG